MKIQNNSLCPCCSGKKYKKCCKMLHDGIAKASNARELMASRYSAFASNNALYIMNTTHMTNKDYSTNQDSWRNSIHDFSKRTHFEHLDILDFTEKENEAFVTFHAVLSMDGQDCSFSEKSRFLKENGQWYYESGEIVDDK